MRRFVQVPVILIVALTLLALAAPAATAADGFRGTWTSTDTDLSNQTLWINGSGQTGRYAVSLYDDAASQACGGAPARAQGSGWAEGDTLYWGGTVTCPGTGRGPVTGRIGIAALMYDADTDTLIDDAGIVWYRQA